MTLWHDELISQMSALTTEKDLFERLKTEARNIGFEHCAYGLRLPIQLANPKTVMFSTYPDTWQARYASENYLDIDPTVRHCTTSLIPLVWTNDLFRQAPNFWEEARSHGLQYGWTQSSVDIQGIRGMLTLSRANEPLCEAELQDKWHQMVWLTQVVHQCMSRLVVSRTLPTASAKLSSREKEVLRWTAEGKTSGEISTIMNIAERTVNFHIANAIEKLNCANKTAASVRAALLGLLN